MNQNEHNNTFNVGGWVLNKKFQKDDSVILKIVELLIKT